MDDGLEIFFIFMAAAAEEEETEELSIEDRRRRSKRFPRASIWRYSQSPFKYMFSKGNDQALLNCCGIDYKVFHELLVRNCSRAVRIDLGHQSLEVPFLEHDIHSVER